MISHSLKPKYASTLLESLWCLEAVSVCLGIVVAFALQYFWHMSACLLCWIDRWVWMGYALLVFRAWYVEVSGRQSTRWINAMRCVRYGLIIISILHLAIIKGVTDFCLSPELMALRGGVWSWFASFNVRSCAVEPELFGWLPIPIGLLIVYLYWELLEVARAVQRHLGSENV